MGDEGQLVRFEAGELAKIEKMIKEMQPDDILIAFKDLSTKINKAIGMLPTKLIPILQKLYVSYWSTRTAIAVAFTSSSGILSEFVIKSWQVMQHGMNKEDRRALMTVEDQLQPIINEFQTLVESSRTELIEIHKDLRILNTTGNDESMRMVDELCLAVKSGQESIVSAGAHVRVYLRMIAVDEDLLVTSIDAALKFMNMADAYMGASRIQNIKQVLKLE